MDDRFALHHQPRCADGMVVRSSPTWGHAGVRATTVVGRRVCRGGTLSRALAFNAHNHGFELCFRALKAKAGGSPPTLDSSRSTDLWTPSAGLAAGAVEADAIESELESLHLVPRAEELHADASAIAYDQPFPLLGAVALVSAGRPRARQIRREFPDAL